MFQPALLKTVSFDAALLKFDDISPYVFDRIHIDTLRRPRQNFDFVPMLNESFFFTMRDVWMGDWSWTSFTFWSGNIALMEGRKTFCKISRFFSFTNFPSNLTKSCLGHHSRNIPTPELMSARSVEHIEYVRNRTAFHFFGTRRRDNTHRSCRWTRRIINWAWARYKFIHIRTFSRRCK